MRRRNFFIVSILSLIGIFCWLNFFARADSNFETIIPVNYGDISATEILGWQYSNCVSGDSFIGMRTSTSTIISPIIDLSDYLSAKFNFSARTYYGSGDSAQISIFISEDEGISWQNIYSYLPTTSTMTTSTDFSLDNYLNKQIRIKLQTLSATGYKGAGITNIFVLGIKDSVIPTNTPPQAIIHNFPTGHINEATEFDASSSTDDENNISQYYWDFGDSSSSAEMIAQHIFPAVGDYLITLTVTDDLNASSTATTTINILPAETTSTPSSTSSTVYHLHDMVINEFVSGPTSNNLEWIELYNNTSSTIDLNGWKINDGSSRTTTVATTTTPLEPENFFVIYGVEGNLNNTGDLILLKDPLNNIIDQMAYGNWDDGNISDNAPATDDNYATARNVDGQSGNNDKIDFSVTITPTPGQSNIITPEPISGGGGDTTLKLEIKLSTTTVATTTSTTTTDYTDDIIINEILPRPATDEVTAEFIELKNLSTTTINLAGWTLADNSTNKYTFPLDNSASTTINANSFLVIERSRSKIALNNNGVEAVKLYSPDNKLIDLTEYKGPVEKDRSYSRDEKGIFTWTSTPTPGEKNIFSLSSQETDTPDDPSGDGASQMTSSKKTTKTTTVKITKISAPAQKIDLKNISTLSIGDKVITQGIVSVEPGVLGAQIFYLAGSGIQIYCNKKDFPSLRVGDNIEVNGTLSEASGERRIKISGKEDIKIISQNQRLEIHQIPTSEVGEEMIGSLVKIKGEVIEVKGSYIYIDDGSEEAKIYIKASTGITMKDLNIKPGDQLETVGIISNSTGGYRLLPRYATDINKTGEVKGAYTTATPPNSAPDATEKYLLAVIIFLVVIVGWLVSRSIIQKNKNKKE